MTNLIQLAEEIQKHDSFLLSGHIGPEGDCAGSILGMERLLKKLGKKTQVYCESPFPKTLTFLESSSWKRVDEFQTPPPAAAAVTLDTPNWERLGTAAAYLKTKPVINIDHHISNQSFATLNYIDAKASACGEIVFDLFEHFKIPIDLETAKTLYTSISTDTGSFRYSSTTAKTHRIIASLLAAGLNVEKINQDIYDGYEEARLRILELILKHRKFAFNGQVSYSLLPHEGLLATGGTSEDMEGLIDWLRGIRGVMACFIATEWKKGTVKLSFRSSTDLDVNAVASVLGGGGHKKAAGATLPGTTLEAAEKKILSIFSPLLR